MKIVFFSKSTNIKIAIFFTSTKILNNENMCQCIIIKHVVVYGNFYSI